MTELKLSREDLEKIFEELCVARRCIRSSDGTQKQPQLKMECTCTSSHSSEMEILMPSLNPRTSNRSPHLLKEKETCTSEDNCEQITHPVKSESKMSQTTYNSSLTIHTDMLGDLRSELLHPKGVMSSFTSSEDRSRKTPSTSSVTDLADKASNTVMFHCGKHSPRCFSRHKYSKSRSLIISKLNVIDAGKETKRSKKEAGVSSKKIHHQHIVEPHPNKDDFSKNYERKKKDTFIEYNNGFNADVYQNTASWSRTPFTPAEKESRNSTISSDSKMKVSLDHKPLGLWNTPLTNSWESEKKTEEVTQNNGSFTFLKNNFSNTVGSVSYSESQSSSQPESSFGRNPWTCGLKSDIISNLDKCFRETLHPSLRLTRSDSTMAVSKLTAKPKKDSPPKTSEGATQQSHKKGKPIIYWAITKINIYPDNSRTYEVMPLTGKKPSEVPDKSDSVFVLIPPLKGGPQSK